uniref:Uncharacterized protein n=1 Tax=Anopheles quadriannulatus TaxID=34691 RepID=A0A182X3G7_ANOQN
MYAIPHNAPVCCGCCWEDSFCIWMLGVEALLFDSTAVLSPSDEPPSVEPPSVEPPRPEPGPPSVDGLMPPLRHGTPMIGSGSSGGVTYKTTRVEVNHWTFDYLPVAPRDHSYLQSDATVQSNLDRVRVIRCLHQGRKVADADFLQR